jgi:anti-sigma regulatory factor (Ser/Thr protein kinase)
MNKFIDFFQKKDNQRQSHILPFESMEELLHHTEVGSLAYRLGYHLEKGKEISNASFFASLFKSPDDASIEAEELLSYAKLVCEWIEAGQNVKKRIAESHFPEHIEYGLIQTFKEYKEELHKRKSMFGKWENNRKENPGANYPEWKIYRDVMNAVTQRKFLLIKEKDAKKLIQSGHILYHGKVKERKDIPARREEAKMSLENIDLSSLRLNSLLLVISEATTNVIKHAEEGEIAVAKNENSLHVIVKDKGPGYVLKDLPNTILLEGYSTKKSLGQGFTLMLKIVDKIQLALTSEGSILVLTFVMKKDGSVSHA